MCSTIKSYKWSLRRWYQPRDGSCPHTHLSISGCLDSDAPCRCRQTQRQTNRIFALDNRRNHRPQPNHHHHHFNNDVNHPAYRHHNHHPADRHHYHDDHDSIRPHHHSLRSHHDHARCGPPRPPLPPRHPPPLRPHQEESPTLQRPTTSTSAPTTTTTTTTPTLEVLGTTVEAAGPAAGLSATAFSLIPATVAPGNEIALRLTLVARVPGVAAVQFLLNGEPLGDSASLLALDSSAEGDTQAVFTRTMPTGMQIGLHRVEVVTTGDTPQVLASRTVGVVAGDSAGPVALDQTPPPSSNGAGLTVAIAVGAVLALAGAGFAGNSWYRRRAIVRRLNP